MGKKETTTACILSLPLRMYIFEQLQGHFDVNIEQRVKMNGQKKDRERKKREKRKGNTNEQRTLAHTQRSGILF